MRGEPIFYTVGQRGKKDVDYLFRFLPDRHQNSCEAYLVFIQWVSGIVRRFITPCLSCRAICLREGLERSHCWIRSCAYLMHPAESSFGCTFFRSRRTPRRGENCESAKVRRHKRIIGLICAARLAHWNQLTPPVFSPITCLSIKRKR